MKNFILFFSIAVLALSCSTTKKSISQFEKQSADNIAVIIRESNSIYFTNLQDAFESVESGDSLIIREGIYTNDKAMELWEKENVTILGEGECKLICNNIDDNVFWIITCKNVIIKNIHATHTQPAEGLSCVGNVFALDMGSGITIEGCDINGCGAIGVYIFGTTNICLKDNKIHDNTIWAVEQDGYGILEVEENDVVKFINCKLYNNGSKNYMLNEN
jgi:parallel beta-helix repeat protein